MMDISCMCKRNWESVDHLLIYCDVASVIWSFFSIVLGCLGLCLDVLLICMTASSPPASQRVLRSVKWCICASFGVYGGK
jgi:hypothetical protein